MRIGIKGQGPILLILPAKGALNNWRQSGVNLSADAGKRLLVSFLIQTGGAPTTFSLDEISIRPASADENSQAAWTVWT